MKLTKLHINNFHCIEDLTIELGDFTVVQGPNGEGKSSVLGSIRAVFEGGHDSRWLRNGAESGFIILWTDDGTVIKKTFDREKSQLSVKSPKFGPIKKAPGYVKSLIDPISFDPVRFLTAKPVDRKDYLLKSMPLQLTEEQYHAFLPDAVYPEDKHALELIDQLYSKFYEERHGLNSKLRDKKGTIDEMLKSIPEGIDEDFDAAIAETERDLEENKSQIQLRISEARKECLLTTQAAKAEFAQFKSNAERELAEALATLKAECQEKINTKSSECYNAVEKATELQSTKIESANGELSESINELTGHLASLRERRDQSLKAKHTQSIIDNFTREAEDLDADSETLSGKLKGLDTLKNELLQSLPIPGLEIKDGEVWYNGVDWPNLNTAKRNELAFKITRLNEAELKLVEMDDLEHFDAESFEEFTQAALLSGSQFIGALVTNDEFKVELRNAEDLVAL